MPSLGDYVAKRYGEASFCDIIGGVAVKEISLQAETHGPDHLRNFFV